MVFLTYQRPAPFISGFLTLSTASTYGFFKAHNVLSAKNIAAAELKKSEESDYLIDTALQPI